MINIAFSSSAHTILAPRVETFTRSACASRSRTHVQVSRCVNPVHGHISLQVSKEDSLIPACSRVTEEVFLVVKLLSPIRQVAFFPHLSFFPPVLLFNCEATMTGDKLAISPRATHQGQQKMNCPRSILHSLSLSLSLSLTVMLPSPPQIHRKVRPT